VVSCQIESVYVTQGIHHRLDTHRVHSVGGEHTLQPTLLRVVQRAQPVLQIKLV
jgi:hypothetical protein